MFHLDSNILLPAPGFPLTSINLLSFVTCALDYEKYKVNINSLILYIKASENTSTR